jgi:ABC-2 type transport system ATP-binding protein
VIEAIELTKYYGAKRGVEGLSFTAQKGEILGLLGPNGAGKTTTIKLLTGFFVPSEGRALVGGFDVQTQPQELRRCLGYLPENAPSYMNMQVGGFLRFMLNLKRPEMTGASAKKEIARVLELADLSHRQDDLVRSLSKGLRQRVGLAQALLGDPDVLILDEPTAGLDPQQVLSVRRVLQQEVENGKTVLLSTHILSEVELLASKIVILNQGRLVAFGSPRELNDQGTSQTLFYRLKVGDETSSDTIRQVVETKLESTLGEGADNYTVYRVAIRDGEAEGSIKWKTGDNPAPLLVEAFSEKGWAVLELREEQSGLEEVFLESVASTAGLQ